jgi:hypothetical protein
MFGFRKAPQTRYRGGSFGGNNLRRALIAGAGMLAVRWWRNRQASGRGNNPGQPAGSGYTDQTAWTNRV